MRLTFVFIVLLFACRNCPKTGCVSPLDSNWFFLEGFAGLQTGDTVYFSKYGVDNIWKAKDSFLLKVDIGPGNTRPDSVVLYLPSPLDIKFNWKITIPKDTIYWFTDFKTLPLTCEECDLGHTWFTWLEYKINNKNTMGYWRIVK